MRLLVILFTLLTNICFAQEIKIDSCGIDSSAMLNQYEVNYFNQSLEKQRKRSGFDFQGKKVGFAHGNYGNVAISKKEYFDHWGRKYYNDNLGVSNQLIVLTEEEKTQSGGYDAIIVSWSKILISKKYNEELIIKIKEKEEASKN